MDDTTSDGARPAGQPQDDPLAWVPVQACTLPTVDQPLRVAEFADLFATALRDVNRMSPTRLRLRLDAAAEHRARDLAARENACCSFFTFGFTRAPDGSLWLDIDVPASHVPVLDGLAAQASHAGPVPSGP